ncbi:hypothetical protein KSF_001250 [Reticulibacter mediterranei]|uniref:Uncharacterized protein n=1 Tax=Reticulibacter mediterranei TaxID=2778369 RepID=A0A8J3N0B4_9CHLR|nr:hypothetical protein [Reticulibacter mediterranei]GHO90077.1 hypothetical protein KSF_001250 [Reticulibacter mediterranei]
MPSLCAKLPSRLPFVVVLSLGIILAAEIAAIGFLVPFTFPSYIANLARPSFLSYIGDLLPFLIAAPLVSLLVGLSGWWLIIERSGRITKRRGIVVGVLGGITAHPLIWTFLALFSQPSVFGDVGPTPDLLQNIRLVITYSLLSLIFAGWITAPVGGIAGALLIRCQRAYIGVSRDED